MRLRAIGRHLLIRMDVDAIKEKSPGGIIRPKETLDKERGGVQFATVLDIGQFAFDDQPGVKVLRGDRILTQRYPGHALDLKQEWNDGEANQYRMILDTEVRGLIDDPDGVEI